MKLVESHAMAKAAGASRASRAGFVRGPAVVADDEPDVLRRSVDVSDLIADAVLEFFHRMNHHPESVAKASRVPDDSNRGIASFYPQAPEGDLRACPWRSRSPACSG